jgi:transposase InsO family protein
MDYRDLSKKDYLVSDFRFGIIADLLNPHLSSRELADAVKLKASRKYNIPFSSKTSVTTSCIRKWLALFKSKGRDGLLPKTRKDKGVNKTLSDSEKELILKTIESHPALPASSAVAKLIREGRLFRSVPSSSLSRFLIANDLGRKSRRASSPAPEKSVNKFSYKYPLECVQSDAMHSFSVCVEVGSSIRKKAILIAFLDDATRRILYADFSFSETSVAFEAGVKHILKAHGKIIRLYTDNGSSFVSIQTKRILDSLGIILIHSKPGVPKGRGKIERFFRTARDRFERALDKDSVKSIHDLNARFHTWLECEYHRTPHSGLDSMTPLVAWLSRTQFIRHIDPSVDMDDVFCHEEHRRVSNDSTVSLDGNLFEVPSLLIGKNVKLRFDPHAPVKSIGIFENGVYYGEAKPLDLYANARAKRKGISSPSAHSLAATGIFNKEPNHD